MTDNVLVPHKHAELIIAWAQGHAIQVKLEKNAKWLDIETPSWCETVEYRIKPTLPDTQIDFEKWLVQDYCIGFAKYRNGKYSNPVIEHMLAAWKAAKQKYAD